MGWPSKEVEWTTLWLSNIRLKIRSPFVGDLLWNNIMTAIYTLWLLNIAMESPTQIDRWFTDDELKNMPSVPNYQRHISPTISKYPFTRDFNGFPIIYRWFIHQKMLISPYLPIKNMVGFSNAKIWSMTIHPSRKKTGGIFHGHSFPHFNKKYARRLCYVPRYVFSTPKNRIPVSYSPYLPGLRPWPGHRLDGSHHRWASWQSSPGPGRPRLLRASFQVAPLVAAGRRGTRGQGLSINHEIKNHGIDMGLETYKPELVDIHGWSLMIAGDDSPVF